MVDHLTQVNFIRLMLPIAQDEEGRSGIKPIITLTQSAHESNWGCSGLTEKANNLFGFTGESWEQEGRPTIKMPTQEWISGTIANERGEAIPGHWITIARPFRAYRSWAESIRDWAALMQKPHYTKAYAAAKLGDLPLFANEVSIAGYATDPHYAAGLIRMADILNTHPEMTTA